MIILKAAVHGGHQEEKMVLVEGGKKPPSIDEVVEKIQKLISKLIPSGTSGGSKPIIFGLILLVVVWAFSGLYRVLPDEQGVVLRFGKFTSTTQPGLNYHIPLSS